MKNRKQNTPVPENVAKGVNFQSRWGNFPKFIFQNILSKKQYSHNTNLYPVPKEQTCDPINSVSRDISYLKQYKDFEGLLNCLFFVFLFFKEIV